MKRMVQATQPTQPSTPLATLEIIDAEVIKDIDPLVPRAFPCWWPMTEPADIAKDGTVVARIAPTDAASTAGDLGLSLDLYDLIVKNVGIHDSKETSTTWLVEGTKAVRDVMRHVPQHSLPRWRGEHTTILRMAQNVGRAYLLPAEVISQLTGQPFEARPGLFAPGHYAKRLDEQARERDKLDAEARASFEASERERTRPRTVAELGLDGVAVQRGRLAAPNEAPWPTAIPAFETEQAIFYLWPRVLGLGLPAFGEFGVEAVRPDQIVPATARPMAEVTNYCAGFAQGVRAKFAKQLDFGPIARERFSASASERVRAYLFEHASYLFFGFALHLAFKQRLAIEVCVRGHLCFPELVAQWAIEARDCAHLLAYPDDRFENNYAAAERANAAAYPPEEEWTQIGTGSAGQPILVRDDPRAIPTSFAVQNLARLPASSLLTDPLASMAVAAVASGGVGAGELLESSEPPTTGKKGSR